MEIDLNTKDTEEYIQWLKLLEEISAFRETLQNEPNINGLKVARTLAYNILADIHTLIDQMESLKTNNSNDNIANNTDLN